MYRTEKSFSLDCINCSNNRYYLQITERMSGNNRKKRLDFQKSCKSIALARRVIPCYIIIREK